MSTLAVLAVIEHLFMAIPFRDAKLWNWLLPKFEGQPKRIKVLETKASFHRRMKMDYNAILEKKLRI